jgi:hypothetical protein
VGGQWPLAIPLLDVGQEGYDQPSRIKDQQNKVDTKPQARSNFDVTSFRRKQILQNFIVVTDHPSIHPSDGWTE